MIDSRLRFTCFPLTEPPPAFVSLVMGVFRAREKSISTHELKKGLTSDEVMAVLRDDLTVLGFVVEGGKQRARKIQRPVFYGENGVPTLQYEIDAYHSEWRCGLEIEAGRGWMGNAVYRDLVQALVMVDVDFLILAVANSYKYQSGGRTQISHDYDNACAVAQAIYGHTRVRMPYRLLVVGY